MDKKSTLIVEDDPITAKMLDSVLKEKGYEVLLAANGHQAMTLLQTSTPHLIISDILMPEVSGFDFFKMLQKSPATSRIPVIIISSHKSMAEGFLSMGADDFIQKPIDTQKLLKSVAALLSKEKNTSAPIIPDPAQADAAATQGNKKSSTSLPKEKIIIAAVIIGIVGLFFFMIATFMSQWGQKRMGEPEQVIRQDQSAAFQ